MQEHLKDLRAGGRPMTAKEKLQRENEKLQNNWNELKKWLNEQVNYYSLCDDDYKEFNVLSSVEGKMQELEGNNE